MWLGHVTVTGAELFQSAGHWGFMSELIGPRRRGEYQGAAELGGTLGSVWAPAVFTFLAMEWGWGRLTIAAGSHPCRDRASSSAHAGGRWLTPCPHVEVAPGRHRRAARRARPVSPDWLPESAGDLPR